MSPKGLSTVEREREEALRVKERVGKGPVWEPMKGQAAASHNRTLCTRKAVKGAVLCST